MSPRLRDDPGAVRSLYLRQHLDNPVAWWSWGDDALAEARRLDRPLFVSVGYAACHWCHVMAHESFEDPGIAEVLNARFVPIKVDREERPDVDALYMAAVQLASGHGGWPMSVFALPDGRPFLAGTYYPPVERGGQVGFARLLEAVGDAWAHRRDLVEHQAAELTDATAREVRLTDHLAPAAAALDLAAVRRRLRDQLVERVDRDGGFGPAPKFPRASYLRALFEFDDDAARDAVARTLGAMSRRGLYDHLDGGFARYSVDGEWHVPHFEKMLCDQALLARCYLEAALVYETSEWASVGRATLDFVERALSTPDGYAAALDADAGGVEGAHVTLTAAEVRAALAGDLAGSLEAALARWRIDEVGAFEGRSVPRLADGAPFATPEELAPAAAALAGARRARPLPARDDQVVLEWNAYVASALLAANAEPYRSRALALLERLAATHYDGARWWRSPRSAPATAGDLAALLEATLDAFGATGDDAWLERARQRADALIERHWEGPVPSARAPHVGGGVVTPDRDATDLLARPKDVLDGATPSAHALATRGLARLAHVEGDPDRLAVAQRLVELAQALLVDHPLAVPDLVEAAGFALEGVEVVVPGAEGPLTRHLRSRVVPRTVVVTGEGSSPLLAGREAGRAYVCRAGVCHAPVDGAADLDGALREVLSWR